MWKSREGCRKQIKTNHDEIWRIAKGDNMIKRLFIKNYKETSKPEIRNNYGKVAGIFGIISKQIDIIPHFYGIIPHLNLILHKKCIIFQWNLKIRSTI